MDELLRAWETTFGCSTLPFGVAEVLLDDRGRPYDFAYRYINAAAASLTGHVAEDLLGEEAYALWGGDPIWLDHFYEAAYKGRAFGVRGTLRDAPAVLPRRGVPHFRRGCAGSPSTM